jgi:hypothetical protein
MYSLVNTPFSIVLAWLGVCRLFTRSPKRKRTTTTTTKKKTGLKHLLEMVNLRIQSPVIRPHLSL